ncbi:hypothetical protein BO71DRAFT_127265 [Aspergillus ellipticus CBS 707.79]|uniref:Uncharacterized protein n=1 Tax=Aspergillus ellipticus CBS 707.79 TaxID=1448320 RepID=A0A319DCP2_9EURO|nr:hypothetical protein BO71DRAFT_127265 [Aspergillus ellipticus CBS 707.79]
MSRPMVMVGLGFTTTREVETESWRFWNPTRPGGREGKRSPRLETCRDSRHRPFPHSPDHVKFPVRPSLAQRVGVEMLTARRMRLSNEQSFLPRPIVVVGSPAVWTPGLRSRWIGAAVSDRLAGLVIISVVAGGEWVAVGGGDTKQGWGRRN